MANEDPRQTRIPGTEGSPAAQAVAAIRQNVAEEVDRVWGKKPPPPIDKLWWEQQRALMEASLTEFFQKGLAAGVRLSGSTED